MSCSFCFIFVILHESIEISGLTFLSFRRTIRDEFDEPTYKTTDQGTSCCGIPILHFLATEILTRSS